MEINKNLNHSCAHLLAAAVLQLYPKTKLGIGPAIDYGFYYDFLFENPISDKDLKKIKNKMIELAKNNYEFVQTNEFFELNDQPFKKELINDFKKENKKITFNQMINSKNEIIFTDLCKGYHINNTSQLKHFELLNLAGAYWKGDSNNIQLTRIYGTCFDNAKDLESFITIFKTRKERDHRYINQKLNLFTFDEKSGRGVVNWLPNGLILKNQIKKYLEKIEKKYGFIQVETSELGSIDLYKTSGHLDHYLNDMFPIMDNNGEKLILRPMSCPHHILLYRKNNHSYKELPIRFNEHAKLYRNEKSGALTGLERVRAMELTDAHIFARVDQIEQEFLNCYKLINEVLKKFKIEVSYISLSLHDPNDKQKFYNDPELWDRAEKILKNLVKKLNIEVVEKVGDAAFYGPKLDIQVKTALFHEITISTLQLDFLQPKNFKLTYVNKGQELETPIMIHRGLVGTYERFISILLEQTMGNLDFWLAPNQIDVIPLSNKFDDYALDLKKRLDNNYRIRLLNQNESLSKRIRNSQINKTKCQIIIGEKEAKTNTYSVRENGKKDNLVLNFEQLEKWLLSLMDNN